MAEAYARVRDGEVWLVGMHIAPYDHGGYADHEPRRPRKLLLHKEEILRLQGRVQEKGLTLVPLRLYFKRGRAKVELGLARGKQLWDKRRAIAEREALRETARAVGRR